MAVEVKDIADLPGCYQYRQQLVEHLTFFYLATHKAQGVPFS